MSKANTKNFMDTYEELNLFFIDEERNKDLENRFLEYINHCSNLNKKDKSDNSENEDNENKANNLKVIKLIFVNK